MKVGVIGYKGFVGSAIHRFFSVNGFETVGIGRENYAESRNVDFGLLVNANGSSRKRLADQDPKTDFEANVKATLDTVLDFKYSKYVYLSTIDVYNNPSDPSVNSEDAAIDSSALSNYGFDKYLGELVVKKHSKSWLVFRLGGMVGPNLKKNMVYDIISMKRTFVSPKSEYQYIDTPSVARTILKAMNKELETYNLCGNGTVSGEEVARLAGVELDAALYSQRQEKYEVDLSKVSKLAQIPKTLDCVKRYLEFARDNKPFGYSPEA